jgi:hypothetical protein
VVRSLPVLTKEENADVVLARPGDVFIDFRGIIILGVPYGFLYYRMNITPGPTKVQRISTKLGGMAHVLSADMRTGIISPEEFEKLQDNDLFGEVMFVEI